MNTSLKTIVGNLKNKIRWEYKNRTKLIYLQEYIH